LRILFVVIAAMLVVSPALADRRSEKVAKDALKKAEDDYLQMTFDKGLRRLQSAERGCGESGCTPETHAALARDIGVMQFRLGQKDAANASFRRAKKIDPKVQLNPSYETPDLREAWSGSAPAPPATAGGGASGDFTHAPPAAAQALTPLAIYVEPATDEAIASVVVRYQSEGTKSFRRQPLKKMGKGWGGYIPCADVTIPQIRYYVQGFDTAGELVASLGDPKTAFSVPVKDSAEVIALPGQKAPSRCGEEDLENLDLLEGERCEEDRQCRSGSCASGRCTAPTSAEQTETGPREWARVWIGVSGSLDFVALPSKSDVCLAPNGVPQTSYWCATPGGQDYPANKQQNDDLIQGRAGGAQGQLTTGGAHVVFTVDFAPTPNILVGGRFGYVLGAYPGSAASSAGKTMGAPLHFEVRGTYVFGDEPLTKEGLAAYSAVAVGYARWDASQTVNVGEKTPDGKTIPGDRAVNAWLVAGPAFASLGGGARYQFSPRVAAQAGLLLTAAVFPGAFNIVAAPEMQLQYGF
ncbi:MAG TPA: hypothetical protein VIF62_32365, partial [Labilithrix sp.]